MPILRTTIRWCSRFSMRVYRPNLTQEIENLKRKNPLFRTLQKKRRERKLNQKQRVRKCILRKIPSILASMKQWKSTTKLFTPCEQSSIWMANQQSQSFSQTPLASYFPQSKHTGQSTSTLEEIYSSKSSKTSKWTLPIHSSASYFKSRRPCRFKRLTKTVWCASWNMS